ncbi:MAG TPA: putative zinc-binding metallopeptidase, partial [Rubrivivax sp.]|nr:putative zinc-binding metallopeptidase [Rubrivivax sp.]
DASPGAPPSGTLCRCCRLTRTLPDLSQPGNADYWMRISSAQRRLVSTLIALKLPVRSKVDEDPVNGLAFDLLHTLPGGPPIVTGHASGVITIDVEEADDARREQRRSDMHEPYRTMLGHLRHECGHYYWERLVLPNPDWLDRFRALFGDERQDYAAALQAYYSAGAPPDWSLRHISAYASAHPWEDWAETWAHYLHLVDTLDTARSFGLDGSTVELDYERFHVSHLECEADPQAEQFVALINGWMELTGVLNELSRSMGVADFYPFVLSLPSLRKLHLIHRITHAQRQGATA